MNSINLNHAWDEQRTPLFLDKYNLIKVIIIIIIFN